MAAPAPSTLLAYRHTYGKRRMHSILAGGIVEIISNPSGSHLSQIRLELSALFVLVLIEVYLSFISVSVHMNP